MGAGEGGDEPQMTGLKSRKEIGTREEDGEGKKGKRERETYQHNNAILPQKISTHAIVLPFLTNAPLPLRSLIEIIPLPMTVNPHPSLWAPDHLIRRAQKVAVNLFNDLLPQCAPVLEELAQIVQRLAATATPGGRIHGLYEDGADRVESVEEDLAFAEGAVLEGAGAGPEIGREEVMGGFGGVVEERGDVGGGGVVVGKRRDMLKAGEDEPEKEQCWESIEHGNEK